MMLAIYFCFIVIATIAAYLTTKIKDEVFRVGMVFTSLVFTLVTLIGAPWGLKVFVVLPLLFGSMNN